MAICMHVKYSCLSLVLLQSPAAACAVVIAAVTATGTPGTIKPSATSHKESCHIHNTYEAAQSTLKTMAT
jgi:hypothetical protein